MKFAFATANLKIETLRMRRRFARVFVKAWLKPNLHKIRKTVITLPGFGIIFAELAA